MTRHRLTVRKNRRRPSSSTLLFVTGLLVLGACSLDWDRLDPRADDRGTGGTSTQQTTSDGGTGPTGSGGMGGTPGSGGTGGGSGGGEGGGPLSPQMECQRFCELYVICLGGGTGGGFPLAECAQECALAVALCPPQQSEAFLDCTRAFDECSDLAAFEACVMDLMCL